MAALQAAAEEAATGLCSSHNNYSRGLPAEHKSSHYSGNHMLRARMDLSTVTVVAGMEESLAVDPGVGVMEAQQEEVALAVALEVGLVELSAASLAAVTGAYVARWVMHPSIPGAESPTRGGAPPTGPAARSVAGPPGVGCGEACDVSVGLQ